MIFSQPRSSLNLFSDSVQQCLSVSLGQICPESNRKSWHDGDDSGVLKVCVHISVCVCVCVFSPPPRRCLSCWCPADRLLPWRQSWPPPPSDGCRRSRSSCCSECCPAHPAVWSHGRSSDEGAGGGRERGGRGRKESGGKNRERLRNAAELKLFAVLEDKSRTDEAKDTLSLLCVGLRGWTDGGVWELIFFFFQ